MFKRAIIVLCVLSNPIFGQKDSTVTFGIGANTHATMGAADWGNGLTLHYSKKKHLVYAAVDLYWINFSSRSQNIPGYQIGYSYFLRSPLKRFNVFLNFNFLYSQYAYGTGWMIKYNYRPKYPDDGMSTFRVQDFTNTIGIGIRGTMLKRAHPYLIIGGGFSHYTTKESPYSPYHGNYQYTILDPALQLKFGLMVDIQSKTLFK